MSKHISLRIFAVVLLVSLNLFSACDDPVDEVPRERSLFNDAWFFIKGNPEGAHKADFDHSGWRALELPHDWGIEGPFTSEVGYKGGYLPYPGIGWYRKSFMIPVAVRRVTIEFDGIMRNSKVWLNGEYVGGWPYGYTSFALDLTPFVKRGETNYLAVRVENQDHSSRWYPGSGIYRNVWLTYMDQVHLAPWGIFVSTPLVTEERAVVQIQTLMQNDSDSSVGVELETSVLDHHDSILVQDRKSVNLAAGSEQEFEQQVEVQEPMLWDIHTPVLYKVVTRIRNDGEILDVVETPFGIRSFNFDPKKGFFLNGRSLKIKGVNLHHGLGPLGTAVNRRATERQLEIMKEMGANAIRTAHNPPSPEQLEFCDRLGILVIDETFDTWSEPKDGVPNDYSIWFDAWASRDTEALVRRDRNHPSVILWSIGNEVMNLDTERGKKDARMLAGVCRRLDPTRPVIAGVHLTTVFDDELSEIFDVFGMNYWQDRYDFVHEQFPGIPLLATESSATLSSRGEYHFPVREIYSGYRHESKQISSYDLINTGFGALPDVEFTLQDKPWMAGQFVWSGFDYHGEPDPYEEGFYPAHSSYFGIVDMCGFKKDRFYLYQSQWTEEPFVHLLPHWNWEGREGKITPVFAYSNCSAVELFVNGRSLGKKYLKTGEFRYKWEQVLYEPGSIRAVGFDIDGTPLIEKEIRTAGPAHRITLEPDRKTIRADGQDLSFITVQITDKEGNLCPLASNMVTFTIEGEGSIACVGNGDPTCTESYQASQRSAFHGMCLLVVQSSQKPGEIKVTASTGDLTGKDVTIFTKSDL